MNMRHLIFWSCGLLAVAVGAAEEKVSARAYADVDGRLDELRAARFVIALKKIPLAKVLAPDATTLTEEAVLEAAGDGLVELRRHATHGNPPWTWQEANAAFGIEDTGEPAADAPKGNGFTKPYTWEDEANGRRGHYGPLSLRKNKDELGKPLKAARGATLGFANNRLVDGSGAWNSEGILAYSIGRTTGDSKTEFGPTVEWKSAETEEADKDDTEQLTFAAYLKHYWHLAGSDSKLLVGEVRPFLNTDFSGDHRIWGGEASLEYVGPLAGLHLGDFRHFTGSKNQYMLRIVPKVEASAVTKVGKHTERTIDDDWLRLGALVSLDFRFVVNGKLLELGTSYEFRQQTDRERAWSDQWNTHLTWWLNSNVGLTLENVTGETPIADEEIDQLSFGLEVKF